MTPRVVDLEREHLPLAADLLAQRQRRLRKARVELPERFEDPAVCLPLLEALATEEGAHGVIGFEGDRPIGYLLGFPRAEEIWARACWSPVEGQALADGVAAEAIRDLYAPWSLHFVQQGRYRQYVLAPADDAELQAAWFRTGFGQMQAHALRPIPADVAPPTNLPFRIRRAGVADLDALQPVLPLISLSLIDPPAYAISLPERFATIREDYAEDLADEQSRYWLAKDDDGSVLGVVAFYDMEPAPMVPDEATEMAVAMTRPSARGRGVMRALVETAWADELARGRRWAVTDWRTASLLAHRAWTALGYVPTHHRLHRHVDERVAWANGRGVPAAE
ncbi:MAG TPA: GNAT family N-acetyltransferase [Candidatus Limnocylindria bacterium]|jgi:GNAT superfamily N-acetyltransferase